jgi:hypothetical protein
MPLRLREFDAAIQLRELFSATPCPTSGCSGRARVHVFSIPPGVAHAGSPLILSVRPQPLFFAKDTMQLAADDEFRAICREILAEDLSPTQWAAIESDDMFQSEHYAGGYDATEEAFCFSHYTADGEEYWFQLSLPEITAVVAGDLAVLDARLAER